MILHVLIAMLAGWLQRHQQQVIAYLQEENRVLKAQLSPQRLRLTDTERRRDRNPHRRTQPTRDRVRADTHPHGNGPPRQYTRAIPQRRTREPDRCPRNRAEGRGPRVRPERTQYRLRVRRRECGPEDGG